MQVRREVRPVRREHPRARHEDRSTRPEDRWTRHEDRWARPGERPMRRPPSRERPMRRPPSRLPAARKVPKRIAVAVHDIEPATFERCALIRDWLNDHGVDRVTLLVIPARDLHPLGERSPDMTRWLIECRRSGDSIAQHGFQHEQLRGRAVPPATLLGARRRTAEFVGLDGEETRRAVDAGWRVLKLAGIEADGFVAPAYAYTRALRQLLPRRFRWWAGLLGLYRPPAAASATSYRLAPAWSMGAGGLLR